MILVDPKGYTKQELAENVPRQFVNRIKQLGVSAEISDLSYGDFAFEGRGPQGSVAVGVERKTLHDMLTCIEDSRYSAHQRIGMKSMYNVSVLMLEGYWKPHDPQGILMEGFSGGTSWAYCRHGSQRTMYSKLYRYLISVQLTGVIVSLSRDIFHTAYNVVEWYQYFQKAWSGHISMQELHKMALPQLHGKPPLVRKWAADIEGVGVKMSDLAARHFKRPITLAQADESEWLRIPGVGVKTAQQIVREVWGNR